MIIRFEFVMFVVLMIFQLSEKYNQAKWGFLLLSPLLLVYIVIVFLFYDEAMVGDEGRYLWFADNLLKGFYSPPRPNISLWNGPGYPMFLSGFLWLDASNFQLVLLNACLHFGSVMLLFAILRRFFSQRISLLYTLIWAFWFFAYADMIRILSESFAIFQIALFAFLITSKDPSTGRKLLAGFTLGLIILTKVIFFYVFLVLVLFYSIDGIIHWKKKKRAFLFMFLTAFVTLLPYLTYSYQLTGKLFYLSNAGGMSLYWMSSPQSNEYGDWNAVTLDTYCWESNIICNQAYFEKHHGAFMAEIEPLDPLARDDAFRSQAISNIKQYPTAFAKNVVANFLRMFFNYPESYNFPRNSTLARMIPGAFLMCISLISIFTCLFFIKHLPKKLLLIFLMCVIYLGGSSLLSSYPRMLHAILPILLIVVAQTFTSFLSVKAMPLSRK